YLVQAVRHEIDIWAKLKHRNILPLYGVTDHFGPFLALVCPWAENGTLTEYLEKYRTELDLASRLSLLADIAAGIRYLHSQKVIHGDLSGSNVLVYADGTACLSDFGLSTIYQEFSDTSEMPSLFSFPGNIRWAAPELFMEHGGVGPIPRLPSQQADIYSFGSIMLLTLTGKHPFHGIRRIAHIVILISRGQRPSRELGWDGKDIPDALWNFIQQCWGTPSDRPSSEDVGRFFDYQRATLGNHH
ncbi:kinase-like domain-containing protein, partial [Melanogaster broomeanus]